MQFGCLSSLQKWERMGLELTVDLVDDYEKETWSFATLYSIQPCRYIKNNTNTVPDQKNTAIMLLQKIWKNQETAKKIKSTLKPPSRDVTVKILVCFSPHSFSCECEYYTLLLYYIYISFKNNILICLYMLFSYSSFLLMCSKDFLLSLPIISLLYHIQLHGFVII